MNVSSENCQLTTIKQITLRMDGKDEERIPYATYMTANSTEGNLNTE